MGPELLSPMAVIIRYPMLLKYHFSNHCHTDLQPLRLFSHCMFTVCAGKASSVHAKCINRPPMPYGGQNIWLPFGKYPSKLLDGISQRAVLFHWAVYIFFLLTWDPMYDHEWHPSWIYTRATRRGLLQCTAQWTRETYCEKGLTLSPTTYRMSFYYSV